MPGSDLGADKLIGAQAGDVLLSENNLLKE